MRGLGLLPLILIDPALDPLWVLINPLRLLAPALFLAFAWRFSDQRPWLPLPVLMLPAALGVLANPFALHNPLAHLAVKLAIALAALFALLAVVSLVLGTLRRRGDASTLLLGTISIAVVMGVWDALAVLGMVSGPEVVVFHHLTALPALVLGAILLWRFGAAVNLQRQFNQQLQAAVVAAEARLHAAHAREQGQIRARDLQQERSRLIRDLHDGLSGQLVSIQSLCEAPEPDALQRVAAASRAALIDLRMVIASLDDVGDDLGLILGDFRERLEAQVRTAGLTLDWRVRRLPPLPGLHPTEALSLLRLLQEAVLNALRHARAARITVENLPPPTPDWLLRLQVRDNGHGGAAPRPGGRGLPHMQQRAAALGARLGIDSGPQGTTVSIDLHRPVGDTIAAPASEPDGAGRVPGGLQ